MKKIFRIIAIFGLMLLLVSCGKKQKSFTVIFDGDGATLISGSETQIVKSASEIVEPKYEKEGYKFDGWDIDISSIKKDANVKANWTIVKFIVTFDGNGGTLVSGTKTKEVIKGREIIAPVYEKEGYIFIGWDKDLTTLSEDTTVKALWEIKKIKITFDGNGGTLTSGEEIQNVVKAKDIVAPTFTKEGYVFVGWDVELGSITTDTTVKALWEVKKYTVTFDGDGGTLSRGSATQVVTDPSEIVAPAYRREGYVFVGWDTDLETIKDDATVKAVWEVYKFTVTFDGDGGILVSGADVQTVTNASEIVPPTYTKFRYYLKEWSVDFSKINVDTTVKAVWAEIRINVKFEGNGGTLISGDAEQVVSDASDIVPPSYERNGFLFEGWNINLSSITKDATVYPIWTPLVSGKIENDEFIITKLNEDFDGYILEQYELTNQSTGETKQYTTKKIDLETPYNGYTTIMSIPASVEYINFSSSTFTALNKIDVAEGNTKFNSKDNCNALIETNTNTLVLGCKSSIIPSTVTNIGKNSFYGCIGLSAIEIPEGILSIGENAFYGCIGLTTITIPNTVLNVGKNAFGYCYSLISLTLPFIGDSKENPSDVNFGYLFGANSSTENSLYIPEALKEVSIIGGEVLHSNSFNNCNSLTKINILNGVRTIEAKSFNNCSSLRTVEISDCVMKINQNAFDSCSNLTTLSVPFIGSTLNDETNNHFGYIFGASTYEENITAIPASLKTLIIAGGPNIVENAFYGCSNITNLQLSQNVTSIDPKAFVGCTSIKSILIDENNPVYDSRDNCAGIIKTASNSLIVAFKNTIIPESVTSIDPYAFYKLDTLTNYVVPSNITNIGLGAFYQCTKLESITLTFIGANKNNSENTNFGYIFGASNNLDNDIYIPASLKNVVLVEMDKIFADSFKRCSYIESITIAESITSIDPTAFSFCDALKTIVVNENNTVYDSRDNCNAIIETATNKLIRGCKNTTFPESINSIGENAFLNCLPITNMVVPNNITSIGLGAFMGCNNMVSISIPFVGEDNSENGYNRFNSIFGGATYDGSHVPDSLTTVVVTGGTTLGTYAFSSSGHIKSLTLPETLTSISYNALYKCNDIETLIIDPNNPIYDSRDNCNGIIKKDTDALIVAVKVTTIPETVKILGPYVFSYRDDLTTFTIPNNIISIDKNAFYECENLTEVIIGNNVEVIGENAFRNCYMLENVTIPYSVTTIKENAFNTCESLKNITVPESVTSIGISVFANCIALKTIRLPFTGATLDGNENTQFGYIFGATSYLDNGILIPSSLKTVYITHTQVISDYAFYECSNISSISIPNDVNSIGKGAFQKCSELTGFEFPTAITEIKENTFTQCSRLDNITIPNSVKTIGDEAFMTCRRLANLSFTSGLENVGVKAFHGTAVTSLTLQNSVRTIGDNAFGNCSNLVSITLQEGLTTIGAGAFSYCMALTSLVIPKSVTSMGAAILKGCTSLVSLSIPFIGMQKNDILNTSIAFVFGVSSNASLPSSLIEVELTNVDSVKAQLFYRCSFIKTVKLPGTVTSIGSQAFALCESLTDIYFDGAINLWVNVTLETNWNQYVRSIIVHANNGTTSYNAV